MTINTASVPFIIWLVFAVGTGAGAANEVTTRWYTPAQVVQGRKLFADHCAECHGNHAEGAKSWKTQDKDGSFRPPPLDGTAHTWHHDLPLLRMIVREGSVARGGKMPAFAERLSTTEIDAVLAWLQSLWPEDVYRRWLGADKPRVPLPAAIRELLPEEAR